MHRSWIEGSWKKSHLYNDAPNSKMEEWELNIHFFWVVEYHGAEITRFNDGHDDSEGDVKLS